MRYLSHTSKCYLASIDKDNVVLINTKTGKRTLVVDGDLDAGKFSEISKETFNIILKHNEDTEKHKI